MALRDALALFPGALLKCTCRIFTPWSFGTHRLFQRYQGVIADLAQSYLWPLTPFRSSFGDLILMAASSKTASAHSDIKLVEELADILDKSGLAELEYETMRLLFAYHE